jgi:hypothetical protein
MADLANLLLAIDATQVTPAATKLDSLTAAGTRAEAATTNLNTSTTKLRDAYLAAGGSAAEADKIFGKVGATTTTTASATSLLNKALAENATITSGMVTAAAVEAAKRQAVRAEVDLQTKSISAQAAAAAEASAVQIAANEAVAASAVESAAVQVAATETIGIKSRAVSESLVIVREIARGNWSRLAGSVSILVQQFIAITAAMFAWAAGVAVLLSPLIALGLAMERGREQSKKFNEGVISTGNFAGITSSQFENMAKTISVSNDQSVRSNMSVISTLIAGGKYSSDTIALITDASGKLAHMTGQTQEEVAKSFENMKSSVIKFAVTHEQTYHDLTFQQLVYIDNLEKQGRHELAEYELAKDIDTATTLRAKEATAKELANQGYLVTGWKAVEKAASDAWNAMMGWGRDQTSSEKIASDLKAIADTQDAINNPKSSMFISAENNKAIAVKGLSAAYAKLRTDMGAAKAEEDKATASAKALQAEQDKIDARFGPGKVAKDKTVKLPIANDNQVSAAKAEIDVLNKQTASQVILNKAIADGSITVAEAARQDSILNSAKSLQKEIDNDNIEGAADLASGDAKRIIIGNRLLKAAKDLLPILAETKIAQGAAYDAKVSNEIVKQTSAINDQTTAIQKQVKFVGMAADAIALEISREKALQYLKDKGVSASSPDGKAYIDATTQQTAAQLALNDAQSNYNLLLAATQNAATGLGNAFGKIGTAIGNMAVSFQNYTEQQKVFADRQATINILNSKGIDTTKEQTLLTNVQNDAELGYYADSIGGLKNMFGQKTAAYEALNAIEGTMQAIRLARKIEDIATNIPQTISNITAGAAKMFAELGPFGFAAVAAMMAVMAAVGFSGGGSSAGPVIDDGQNGGTTAKANQAAQGSGSVLGDSAAKSASIANSLTQLEKNSNSDLEYSNQMVVSLKAIQSSIGKVASSLAGQLTTGGSLSTTNLGLGTTGSSGILGLFASSTTKVLQDQGVQIAAQTVAQIAASGIAGQTYQQTQTTKTNSGIFGLFGSTSQSSNTTSANLPTDVSAQIGSVISGLASTVLDAANKLGVTGAQAVVDSFSVNIGKISLVGLSGSQITDALNAVFSKVGDDLTNAVIPQVKSLAQVGEGSLETLSRLVNEYTAVDDAMATIGNTFNSVGIDSLAARDNLVQLSGGISQFASQANFFASNFLSSAQALLPIQKAVITEMSSLGFASVTTKAQFASLVQSIDVSTDSGAALYATLMNVAPAFVKVADAATALATQQQTMQITLLQDQGNAIEATNLKRQQELAALDDSLKPLQLAIYAQEDLNSANALAATAATDAANAIVAQTTADKAASAENTNLQITLLQDEGNVIEATNLKRQQQLATLNASLVPIQNAIYAQEDLNAANDNVATSATAAATAQANLDNAQSSLISANDNLTKAQSALYDLLNPAVDTTAALANAHTDLANSYSAESGALKTTISQFGGFATSLTAFRSSLNASGATDPISAYALAKASFQTTSTAARGGDATALGNLQSVGQAFVTASQAASATGAQYQSDLAIVKSAVDNSIAVSNSVASNAEQQLNALNSSVVGLGVLNADVIDTNVAINNLANAQIANDNAVNAARESAIAKAKDDVAVALKAQKDLQDKVQAMSDALVASNAQIVTNTNIAAKLLQAVTQGGNVLLTRAS